MSKVGRVAFDFNIVSKQPILKRYYTEDITKSHLNIKVHHYFGIQKRDYREFDNLKVFFIILWCFTITITILPKINKS